MSHHRCTTEPSILLLNDYWLPIDYLITTVQGCQGRFLAGKTATVVAKSLARRHWHRHIIFCKIQTRPRYLQSCLPWRPCIVTPAKSGFFSESAMCFLNLPITKKKYSKKLSWTWNLNFPPKTVNNKFKFQAQDSFLEYFYFEDWEIWKTNHTFWKKATFSPYF